MAKVLGLSFFFHDSAAALVGDGKVVAAAAEERFSRRKHTNEFPKMAIEYCLEAGNLRSVNELDAVVFYEKPLRKLFRVVETAIATWPRSLPTFVTKLPHFLKSKVNIARVIESQLPGYRGPILFSEHHLSHAASAFYCSPFEESAILTVDGVGEWETTAVGYGSGQEIHLEKVIQFPHSLGLLYSALTAYLGFRVNDAEWKVMGLAPYGQPEYASQFRKLVTQLPDGSYRLNMEYFKHHYSSREAAHPRRWEALFGFPPRKASDELKPCHQNLARSGQLVLEEVMIGLARAAKRLAPASENLVIAGGVGLNSVANWKIEESGLFRQVWVQPAPGDDGAAVGAALFVSKSVFGDEGRSTLRHAYLGPDLEQEELRSWLDDIGAKYEQVDKENLVERVAHWINDGKVVGWARGRMEFGPRALGARSILASPRTAEMKSIVNRKVKYREYFRPFAPSIPLENVHEFFDVPPGTEFPFMLKVPRARADKKILIPAVVHEDGTGRVQTVTEEANPAFYKLLKAVGRLTGVPVLLNTSFNIRGEPMVCSLKDAYQCFLNTGIDILVLGDLLIEHKPATAIGPEDGYAMSDALESGDDRARSSLPKATTNISVPMDRSEGEKTTKQVLSFYREMPFNSYSNAVDFANSLIVTNRVKGYPSLDRFLKHASGLEVLDVGCGAGWFANSCAHFYKHSVTGLDINSVAVRQARSVARLVEGGERARFVCSDLYKFLPGKNGFDVVNSLGVLHHTPDCHRSIRKVCEWVRPGGYLHLGLYHLYGREPFLRHFKQLKDEGASESELLREFHEMNTEITDPVHLRSWFRDQVQHPHETQHTYAEIHQLLEGLGFEVVATSINRFKALNSHEEIIRLEKKMTEASLRSIQKKRYFPGFFVVWARRKVSAGVEGSESYENAKQAKAS